MQEAILNNAPQSASYDINGEVLSVKAVLINARLGYLPGAMENISQPKNGPGPITTHGMPYMLGAFGIAMVAIFSLVAILRIWRSKNVQIERIAEDDEESISMASYRDDTQAGLEVSTYHEGNEEEL